MMHIYPTSPLSPVILDLLEEKTKQTNTGQNHETASSLASLPSQSKEALTNQDLKTTPAFRLPLELIGEIFKHTVTPYTSRKSAQQLTKLMQVDSTFLAGVNYVLKPDTDIRSGWVSNQMEWGEKELTAITRDPKLSDAQVKDGVERVLRKIQYVRIDLGLRQINSENRLIVLKALSNKRDMKSLDLTADSVFSDNPQILVKELVRMSTRNPELSTIYLNVTNNQLSAKHMKALGKILSGKNISTLNLKGNPLGNKGIRILAHYFQLQRPQKTAIDNRLVLTATGINDESVPYLISMLQTEVKQLYLKANEISDKGAMELLEALTKSSVKRISFDGNPLSDALKETEWEDEGQKNKDGVEINVSLQS